MNGREASRLRKHIESQWIRNFLKSDPKDKDRKHAFLIRTTFSHPISEELATDYIHAGVRLWDHIGALELMRDKGREGLPITFRVQTLTPSHISRVFRENMRLIRNSKLRAFGHITDILDQHEPEEAIRRVRLFIEAES